MEVKIFLDTVYTLAEIIRCDPLILLLSGDWDGDYDVIRILCCLKKLFHFSCQDFLKRILGLNCDQEGITTSPAMSRNAFDAVHWYMSEVASRIVAKTGIPSDRYHLGKLILQGSDYRKIDGGTGESETNGSVSDRSIRCAISLTNLGLKKGDVMVLMGPNHLHFSIPHYAALYLGIMVACIDATLKVNELKDLFHTNQPNIIFCQSEKTTDIEKALELAKVDAKIVTFDKDSKYTNLADLLENEDKERIKNFKPTDFDPKETVAYLTSTSGTTGVPKTAMLTHLNLTIAIPYMCINISNRFIIKLKGILNTDVKPFLITNVILNDRTSDYRKVQIEDGVGIVSDKL